MPMDFQPWISARPFEGQARRMAPLRIWVTCFSIHFGLVDFLYYEIFKHSLRTFLCSLGLHLMPVEFHPWMSARPRGWTESHVKKSAGLFVRMHFDICPMPIFMMGVTSVTFAGLKCYLVYSKDTCWIFL